jgi:hypothetical protein
MVGYAEVSAEHGAKAPFLSFKITFGTTEVVPFRTSTSDSGFVSKLRGVSAPVCSARRWRVA